VSVNGSGDARTWGFAGAITVQPEGGQLALCLVGEIDQAVVDAFDEATDGRAPAVDVIDAAAATFLGSAGLALLARVRDSSAAQRRAALLRSASPQVERVLTVSGLGALWRTPATPRDGG
jgi:anti-anti-sigma factor